MIGLLLLLASSASPSCDDPEVRTALVRDWARMSSARRDTLEGSEVKVWDLRRDGAPDECLADFLARRPGAAVGGTLPFRILPSGKGFRLQARGEPRLRLLQGGSAPSD